VSEENILDVSFNESEFELLEMVDLSIVKSDSSIEVDASLYEYDFMV